MAKPSLPKPPAVCQVPTLVDVPIPDILPYRLPGGGISILAGAPNVGKTALLSTLVRDLRDGRPVFGHAPRALPGIGMINADRGWDKGAGHWFELAGYADIKHYSHSDDRNFDPRRLRRKFDRTDLLASFADRLELPPGSLLLIDPLALFLGGNLLDHDTCMVACHEIRSYLLRRRYTLLATAHTGKMKVNKKDRYLRTGDQVMGSTAITGYSDAVLHLAAPEELGKSYYQLTWHPHCAKPETYQLDRNEEGLFVPWEGADAETLRQIVALLPEDGTAMEFGVLVDLAQAIPLSRRTVKNALDKLIDNGVVERVAHGKYGRVPLPVG